MSEGEGSGESERGSVMGWDGILSSIAAWAASRNWSAFMAAAAGVGCGCGWGWDWD